MREIYEDPKTGRYKWREKQPASEPPVALRRVVRCRGGKFKILFARNSVFECFSPPCGRIKAEIFAWLYRMKGEGRYAIVVDAKPTPNGKISEVAGRKE